MDGELVIDLVGVADKKAQTMKYDSETIQNVFSCTKVISSLVIAMLVDRGYITYSTPIAEVWPEFAENGKENITVEELVRHESGLHAFSFCVFAVDVQRKALKDRNNIMSKRIAAEVSNRTRDKETTRKYSFISRGFIENEIVMRVDPEHRTMGEFIRDEIVKPLSLDNQFTLGDETMHNSNRIAPLVHNSQIWLLVQIFNIFRRRFHFIAALNQLLQINVSSVSI